MMRLSERETTIAKRYAEGNTYRQIAAELCIAPSTARNHLAAVYRKLGVRNKPELIRELTARNSDFGILPPAEMPAPTSPILRNLDETVLLSKVGASVAVMPLTTIGPVESHYIGYGISADIHHELTRCHDLFVSGRSSCLVLNERGEDAASVAQTLGVQYVLQGAVRSESDRITVTAELVDGASGAVLWSERFVRALRDVPDIEVEIAGVIAANLSLRIDDTQFRRRRHLGDDALTAYDLRLRGIRLLETGGRQNLRKAREYFERAVDLEPGSAASHAGLSMCFGYECDLLLAENYGESLRRHLELAEKAIALDESDSRGHYAIACGLMLHGKYERADFHAARAVELNPSEYHNLCNRGYSLMSLGRIGESVACFSKSLRRNPLAPNSCLLAAGLIEYLETNYGQAAGVLSRMTGYQIQRASTLAAACAQVGYDDAANRAAQQFRRLSAELPICPEGFGTADWREFWQRAYPYLKDGAFEHMLDGIRKAALPL